MYRLSGKKAARQRRGCHCPKAAVGSSGIGAIAYNRGMIDFVAAHWGSLASIAGLIATICIAWSARSASRSADKVAKATRDDIRRYLQTIDVERAIGLIQRIKVLHNSGQWEAALDQYQLLRKLLSDIIARCSQSQADFEERLADGRTIVTQMEVLVGEQIAQDSDDGDPVMLNRHLTFIQSDLEELASAIGFGDSQGETT